MVHYKVNIDWLEVVTAQVEEDVGLSAASMSISNRGYVQVSIPGVTKVVPLHRFALGLKPKDGLEVHHKNGGKKDNHRVNLELVNRFDNMRMIGVRRVNTSGFIGVTKNASGRW